MRKVDLDSLKHFALLSNALIITLQIGISLLGSTMHFAYNIQLRLDYVEVTAPESSREFEVSLKESLYQDQYVIDAQGLWGDEAREKVCEVRLLLPFKSIRKQQYGLFCGKWLKAKAYQLLSHQ